MALEIKDYPENVKNRPGMWIGSTENCNVMLKELIDNAVDEFLVDHVSKIRIRIDNVSESEDKVLNRFIVADNSNTGFSLDEAKKKVNRNGKEYEESTGRTTMDAALNMLSSSTKFNKTVSQAGMNGVGSAVTNALSKEFIAISNLSINKNFNLDKIPSRLREIYKGEKYYVITYHNGYCKSEIFTNELSSIYSEFTDYSTIVSFIPDLDILETSSYVIPKGLDYVTKVAELSNKELEIIVDGKPYESKLKDYPYSFDVKLKGKDGGKNPEIRLFGSFGLSNDLFETSVRGAVNSMACHEGQHITLFRKAYKDAVKELYGSDCNGSEDMGLNMLVFIMANEVEYDSQSKKKMSRINDFDMSNYKVLREAIKSIMKDNDEIFYGQYMKILNFKDKKGELNKKQKINKLLGMDVNDNSTKAQRRQGSYKPRKLKDAWSSDRKKCELLVFEGDSASSSAHKTRNPQYQAIFPMKGVPINSSKLSITKALKNEEFRELFRGIGAGVDGNFNLKKLRYDKIIYFGDEDEDGARIKALIVGLFLCHAKFIIEAGKLYIGETPFYIQNGKYIYRDELDKLDHSKPFKRVKGLGGLGKDFGPCVTKSDTRRIVQVTLENANEAIQVLKSSSKKKELLLDTKVVSTELYKGSESGDKE